MEESVDILKPPLFQKSGIIKTLIQAWKDEDWLGTFNLWIVKNNPTPSIVYQIRSSKSNWAPGKHDVSAGGHYCAGETIKDGLREVREELGKDYRFEDLTYFGRKMHVSPDIEGNTRHNLVDIFMILDNSPLNNYKLQKKEVYALCECSIEDLLKVHTQKDYQFTTKIIDHNGDQEEIVINKSSFPENWDNYHYKIAQLTERYLKGKKNLIY